MVREYLEKIKENVDVRQNLIALKGEIKETTKKHALLYALGNQWDLFYNLLKDKDPKIRKNIAQILGRLGEKESLPKLFEAYEKEEILFVKGAYLSAIREFDYREYLPTFKERLDFLSKQENEAEEEKHIREEIKELKEMILVMEGIKKHTFTGYNEMSKIILLTNRNFQKITLDQMKSHRAKIFNAGVMAKTDNLEEILPIRTYSELLFVLEDKTSLVVKEGKISEIAESLAKQIAESSLLEFLEKRHKEDGPYYFRIECKNAMDLKQKSMLTRGMGYALEKLSMGKLQNSTSNYEIELRLIENKEGNYNFLIKLFTLKDQRFSYRRKALSTSVQPVNAALLLELARPYLTEGAQVLDPFCGVGTMLVERGKLMDAGDMYGIDIFGKGIEAARENTSLTDIRVNYINRDFFDFTHDYPFDELITNMPRVMGQKEKKDIIQIYQKFWKKAKEHVKVNGILVILSYDKDILKQTLRNEWYTILKEYEISKKEGAYGFIIELNS